MSTGATASQTMRDTARDTVHQEDVVIRPGVLLVIRPDQTGIVHDGFEVGIGRALLVLRELHVPVARLAVDEADDYLRTGSTHKLEEQIIPCDLVTRQNAEDFHDFEKVR